MKNVVKEYSMKYKPTNREAKQIKDSRQAYEELQRIFDNDTLPLFESFYVVYLNSNQKEKGFLKIGEGGLTHVVADPKKIVMGAIGCLATNIIISHNHPSGNPRPSEEDRRLTRRVREACKLLDINLNDHIIIGDGQYYSFRDNGELFD